MINNVAVPPRRMYKQKKKRNGFIVLTIFRVLTLRGFFLNHSEKKQKKEKRIVALTSVNFCISPPIPNLKKEMTILV